VTNLTRFESVLLEILHRNESENCIITNLLFSVASMYGFKHLTELCVIRFLRNLLRVVTLVNVIFGLLFIRNNTVPCSVHQSTETSLIF